VGLYSTVSCAVDGCQPHTRKASELAGSARSQGNQVSEKIIFTGSIFCSIATRTLSVIGKNDSCYYIDHYFQFDLRWWVLYVL
jgi:hypothetical protein